MKRVPVAGSTGYLGGFACRELEAKVAFKVLRRPAKVTSVPGWLMWTVVRLARLFKDAR